MDTWEHAKPKGKWIDVSADYKVLDALVKEKNNHVDTERQVKVQKEKLTCTKCLKKQLQMKKEEKGQG